MSSVTNIEEYQGFWYPQSIVPGLVSAQQHFQALPTDILIAGAVKTGNTWLKALCFAITTRNEYSLIDHHQLVQQTTQMNPLLNNLPHFLIPFLEVQNPNIPTITKSRKHHPLLATHISYTSLPESIITSGCKIIYICREPKDTFVSFFHYKKRIIQSNLGTRNICANTNPECDEFNLERELALFCEGKSWSGPYWDHVLGYHKASLDRPDKFLFLKYEQLKSDTIWFVRKLAAFMDVPFSGEEEQEGVPEKIVKLCSFNSLRNIDEGEKKSTDYGDTRVDNSSHYRKGNVGDWKNELTQQMAEKIDRITQDKLKGVSDFLFG